MTWFDKLLKDLDDKEAFSNGNVENGGSFRTVYDQIPEDKESTIIPIRLLKASIEHDKLIVEKMRMICDEAEGDLFLYLKEKVGEQEATYLSFQISTLIVLLLKRTVSTTRLVEAAIGRSSVQGKGKDD